MISSLRGAALNEYVYFYKLLVDSWIFSTVCLSGLNLSFVYFKFLVHVIQDGLNCKNESQNELKNEKMFVNIHYLFMYSGSMQDYELVLYPGSRTINQSCTLNIELKNSHIFQIQDHELVVYPRSRAMNQSCILDLHLGTCPVCKIQDYELVLYARSRTMNQSCIQDLEL